ncbi:SAM-dependent methyltransferase [Streptomyces sp. HNM0574]|uniref:SAM-dependent methyltransferase n=1 Tax=Streptomyces sp. HNM0574 TaxID=2714954 RepID=UPI00146D6664|nr:SAM-dependent methyltransferase [Streptomyces sp. HNM0574]NLU69842.1 SAM-dependent methyltransferase [Streptomyces sp. HNM0574]
MREQQAVAGVDVNTPSAARMYDHYLGGKDNYEVDRIAVAELDRLAPHTRAVALNNRRFLQRVVRVLAEDFGVRQFLDHGSGLPTQDNVHQVAQRVDPDARVVYVDNDPIVLAHARALLEDNTRTAVVQADLRDTEAIFGHPEVNRLFDLSQPVAALFVCVMHCVGDESDFGGPADVAHRTVDRMAPGSFMVLNQLVSADPDVRDAVSSLMRTATGGQWGRVREEHEVDRCFEGLKPLEPGLCRINTWRPETDFSYWPEAADWYEYGGVGRKP